MDSDQIVTISDNLKLYLDKDGFLEFKIGSGKLIVSESDCPKGSVNAVMHISSSDSTYIPSLDMRYLLAQGYSEIAAFYSTMARVWLITKYSVRVGPKHVKFINVTGEQSRVKVSPHLLRHVLNDTYMIANFIAKLPNYYATYTKFYMGIFRHQHLADVVVPIIAEINQLYLSDGAKVIGYMKSDCLAPIHCTFMAMLFTNFASSPRLKGIIQEYGKMERQDHAVIAQRLLMLCNLMEAAIAMSPIAEEAFSSIHIKVMLSLNYAVKLIFERNPTSDLTAKMVDQKFVKDLDDITALLCAALNNSNFKKDWMGTIVADLSKHLMLKSPSDKAKRLAKEIDGSGTMKNNALLNEITLKIGAIFNVDY